MPKVVSVSKIPCKASGTAVPTLAVGLIAGLGLFMSASSVQAAEKTPYVPSRFPGVQVRQVPAAPAASTQKPAVGSAWLGKRPGTVVPKGAASPLRSGRAATALRTGRGVTAAGGKWVAMPAERVPLSVARVNKSGKAAANCQVPGSVCPAHSKTSHAGTSHTKKSAH